LREASLRVTVAESLAPIPDMTTTYVSRMGVASSVQMTLQAETNAMER
jgi:hypothetical protein